MLLEELIERLDKSDKNKQNIYTEDLEEILRYVFYIGMSLDDLKINTRVTCYWLCRYWDGEYHNGFKVYFLDDKLLALSHKNGEDENFIFANTIIKQELKDYIFSLAKYEQYNPKNYLNLKEDFGDGYDLHYADRLLATHVMYEGQKCEIIYPKGQHADGREYTKSYPNKFDFYNYGDPAPKELINIQLPDTTVLTVDIKEVKVCYNTV